MSVKVSVKKLLVLILAITLLSFNISAYPINAEGETGISDEVKERINSMVEDLTETDNLTESEDFTISYYNVDSTLIYKIVWDEGSVEYQYEVNEGQSDGVFDRLEFHYDGDNDIVVDSIPEEIDEKVNINEIHIYTDSKVTVQNFDEIRHLSIYQDDMEENYGVLESLKIKNVDWIINLALPKPVEEETTPVFDLSEVCERTNIDFLKFTEYSSGEGEISSLYKIMEVVGNPTGYPIITGKKYITGINDFTPVYADYVGENIHIGTNENEDDDVGKVSINVTSLPIGIQDAHNYNVTEIFTGAVNSYEWYETDESGQSRVLVQTGSHVYTPATTDVGDRYYYVTRKLIYTAKDYSSEENHVAGPDITIYIPMKSDITTITTGHSYVDTKDVVDPTCEEGGYTIAKCSVCGAEIHTHETEALGHDYDEGVITKEPTYTEPGEKTFTCKHDPTHTYVESIPIIPHTVSFYDGGNRITTKEIYHGGQIGSLPSAPVKANYKFDGWYTSATGGAKITTGTIINDNNSYYARYTVNMVSVTVTFNGNGGTNGASKTLSYPATSPGIAIGVLPASTRANYAFQGWFTTATGGAKITATTIVKASTVYYAQWKAAKPALSAAASIVDNKIWKSFVTFTAKNSTVKKKKKLTLKLTAYKNAGVKSAILDAKGKKLVKVKTSKNSVVVTALKKAGKAKLTVTLKNGNKKVLTITVK